MLCYVYTTLFNTFMFIFFFYFLYMFYMYKNIYFIIKLKNNILIKYIEYQNKFNINNLYLFKINIFYNVNSLIETNLKWDCYELHKFVLFIFSYFS